MTFEQILASVYAGKRARRSVWANIPAFTETTPPMQRNRIWRIWLTPDWRGKENWSQGLVQGWGGQIGFQLAPDDPIRDGTLYTASDEDRIAKDWELL